MSRYRILDQQGLNYLTCTVVGWVDVYSSARNYANENWDCVLEVDLLEPFLPGSGYVYVSGFDG